MVDHCQLSLALRHASVHGYVFQSSVRMFSRSLKTSRVMERLSLEAKVETEEVLMQAKASAFVPLQVYSSTCLPHVYIEKGKCPSQEANLYS